MNFDISILFLILIMTVFVGFRHGLKQGSRQYYMLCYSLMIELLTKGFIGEVSLVECVWLRSKDTSTFMHLKCNHTVACRCDYIFKRGSK
jgi:hypothetical protein